MGWPNLFSHPTPYRLDLWLSSLLSFPYREYLDFHNLVPVVLVSIGIGSLGIMSGFELDIILDVAVDLTSRFLTRCYGAAGLLALVNTVVHAATYPCRSLVGATVSPDLTTGHHQRGPLKDL